jgi:hypothetical protein
MVMPFASFTVTAAPFTGAAKTVDPLQARHLEALSPDVRMLKPAERLIRRFNIFSRYFHMIKPQDRLIVASAAPLFLFIPAGTPAEAPVPVADDAVSADYETAAVRKAIGQRHLLSSTSIERDWDLPQEAAHSPPEVFGDPDYESLSLPYFCTVCRVQAASFRQGVHQAPRSQETTFPELSA